MPISHQIALCLAIPVLVANVLWWGLWRQYMPGGRFFQPIATPGVWEPAGWWVGFAGPFADQPAAVRFAALSGGHELPYLVDANGEVVPGMSPCTICRSMCANPGGIHLSLVR